MRADWYFVNPPEQDPACLERADFGDPAASPYILPYPVGVAYEVYMTYCLIPGHQNELAYDFPIPLGSDVLAVRAGVVRDIEVGSPDEPDVSANYITIEHDDGSSAGYGHLMQDGALVQLGETVEAGQLIALGGASGTDLAHLHLSIYRTYPPVNGDDLAINFSNAEGPLDERGGLMHAQTYEALP